ncbi:unnamed protein product [Nezara viridula]|uniref:Uncharacterized protein n=1 Tax=Nezara viridula TaxID=85310 RepID=A0A9P0HRX8_NEZVI|nr:unnamed protein product [Nezara viridula]
MIQKKHRIIKQIHKPQTYLLPENGFCLTTITLLFTVVSPSSLRSMPFLRLFILCYFVKLVDFTFFAKCTSLFRNSPLWTSKRSHNKESSSSQCSLDGDT